MTEYKPGELFAYVRDPESFDHIELGQVLRKVDDDTYACLYSTGDTAARTNVRNMRKFANSGWSHVERAGDDDSCKMEPTFIEPVSLEIMQEYTCSKCGEQAYLLVLDEGDRLVRCPNCGRWVR